MKNLTIGMTRVSSEYFPVVNKYLQWPAAKNLYANQKFVIGEENGYMEHSPFPIRNDLKEYEGTWESIVSLWG
jgi:hypothetical protein